MPNESSQREITRRQMLAGLGAAAVGASLGWPGGQPAHASGASAGGYPGAGLLVVRETDLMTMDPALGYLEGADVLVRDGLIEYIGWDISAPAAVEIDGRGMVTMPGFVDTHNHLWLTQLRGLFGNTPETTYFSLSPRLARHYRAEDMETGTLFGDLELLSAGVTTTVDFCDNVREASFAEAALHAHRTAGIRARYLYGSHHDMPSDVTIDLDHLQYLAETWGSAWSVGGLLELGLGWRGPGSASTEELSVARTELDKARGLGIPVSTHASGDQARTQLDGLIDNRFLGPDLQVIHATDATSDHLGALDDAGAGLALTPVTEHRVGYGLTRFAHYAGVNKLGLGVDGNALAGAGDMFAVMRLLALTESGASRDATAVDPHRMLALATSEAARSIGMDGTIGSLTPGKQADLIMIDTRAMNLGQPMRQPLNALLTYSAQPSNVDTVMVAGRLVKRCGQLLGTDVPGLLDRAAASKNSIAAREGSV